MFRVVVFCKLRLHFLFFSVSFLLFMSMLMLMLLSSKLLSHTLHGMAFIALPRRRRRRAQRIHSRRRDTWVGSLLSSPTHTYIITCLWENTRRSFNTCMPSPLLHGSGDNTVFPTAGGEVLSRTGEGRGHLDDFMVTVFCQILK